MLTDIFLNRYKGIELWPQFSDDESKLLVQCFRIISEQLFPYWRDGKEISGAKDHWEALNKTLSMELGLKELSPAVISYPQTWNGNTTYRSYTPTKDKVCETFVLTEFNPLHVADNFMKERISFVELAFRRFGELVQEANRNLPIAIANSRAKTSSAKGILGTYQDQHEEWLETSNRQLNERYRSACEELNTRFAQAGSRIIYHNRFIQLADDQTINREIQEPFWKLVEAAEWKNVDFDIKQAIDLLDTNGRDPAWYAARALESTIKIISDKKGWTHGGEKGAVNYIENLSAKKNGKFIDDWERDDLKRFFEIVRNPFGHGPGSAPMPQLSVTQSRWAIGYCMVWIRSLIGRM